MSWGVELWDHLDVVATHTQKGIEFCERMSNFFKDKCVIENEYSTKIKRLVKTYQTRSGKNDEPMFGYEKAFVMLLNEVKDLAGQREVVAEDITGHILRDLNQLLAELRQARKKYLQDGSRQETTFQAQLNELDKARKQYEKAYKDSEKATEAHQKNEADIHLSRADVEKSRIAMITRGKQCDQSKIDYAAVLQTTNRVQQEHYEIAMPLIFRNLQALEEKRVNRVKEYIRVAGDIEARTLPITNTCVAGMVTAAQSIDPLQDSKLLVDLNKTGFTPPEDIPFQEQVGSTSNPALNGLGSSPRSTLRSTFRASTRGESSRASSRTRKKRGRILSIFGTPKSEDEKEDFSHLPPTQQRKKLTAKIDQLHAALVKLSAERTGLEKMQDVYRNNPKLGDHGSLAPQLTENDQACDQLEKEIRKFEGYLHSIDNGIGMRSNSLSNSGSNVSLSASQQQLSLSHSTTPLTSTPSHLEYSTTTGSTPQSLTPTANSAKCSLSSSSLRQHADNNHSSDEDENIDQSIVRQQEKPEIRPPSQRVSSGRHSRRSNPPDSVRVSSMDPQDSFEDEEVFEPVGLCVALYAFEANNEGALSMRCGEEFDVLQKDAGDGWTRVKRIGGDGEEGFVPTSYIQCRTQTCV